MFAANTWNYIWTAFTIAW